MTQVLLTLALCSSTLAAPVRVAKLKYGGGGDWYSNRSSLPNLIAAVRERTAIDIAEEPGVLTPMDRDLFSYSYIFATGHGRIRFTDEEAAKLREYLLRGGFLHVDDNYGMDPHFREAVKVLFPDRELVELPFDHQHEKLAGAVLGPLLWRQEQAGDGHDGPCPSDDGGEGSQALPQRPPGEAGRPAQDRHAHDLARRPAHERLVAPVQEARREQRLHASPPRLLVASEQRRVLVGERDAQHLGDGAQVGFGCFVDVEGARGHVVRG